jgi:predicted metalloprotease with PDZ domain
VHVQGNKVSYVHALGAAYEAGIQPGDEFVALEGYKLSSLHLPEFLERASTPLTLHYFRQGKLCQTSIFPRPLPQTFCTLRYVDSPSPAQQRARQGWLRG